VTDESKGGGNGKESKSNIFDVLLVLQKDPEHFEIYLKYIYSLTFVEILYKIWLFHPYRIENHNRFLMCSKRSSSVSRL